MKLSYLLSLFLCKWSYPTEEFNLIFDVRTAITIAALNASIISVDDLVYTTQVRGASSITLAHSKINMHKYRHQRRVCFIRSIVSNTKQQC